ncbi:MAG: phage portal protein [Actinoallomurus sp.]
MRNVVGALLRIRDEAPVPYVGRGYSGRVAWGGRADAEHQMRAMGLTGTLFAIIDRLANETARVDWKLYRSAKSGHDDDRVEVTSHAALDIWNKPNKFFTRSEFIETFQQHLDLTGEGWWIVGRNPRMRSIPLELWPVRPDRMMPVPSTNGFLAGYVYLSPDGEQIPLQLDEVIQLRRPNPLDPYRGIGAVQSVLVDVDSARYSAEWNRSFFINGAGPGGILQVDKRLSDGQWNEMVERWREQHQGVANAHRVAIVEQGQWIDSTYSMRDMQFSELRNVQREIIREAFAFPKSELGTADNVNRANAEAGALMLARGHTVPRCERIKGALNADFLPLFGTAGKGLEFDYCSPVPEDRDADNAERESKATAYSLLTAAGVDPVDAAEVAGLPKMRVVIRPTAPAPAPEPSAIHPAPVRAALTAPVRAADGDRLPPGEQPDITPLQASWQAALAELLRQWTAVTASWIDALVSQIRGRVAAGDRAGLADIAVPDHDIAHAAALLRAAMVKLAHDAARQVVGEADAQGVELRAGIPDEDALGDAAEVVAKNLAREAATDASREALRNSPPGVIGDQEADRIATAVRQDLEADEQEAPQEWLGNALTQAQQAGRTATFKGGEDTGEVPVPAYYASEKNDAHTCVFCKEVNGRWLGNSIAAADAEYPSGGYVRCLGRERCRGTVVAVWRPKQVEGDDA